MAKKAPASQKPSERAAATGARNKSTTTIRVDVSTHARLMALSEDSGRSIVDLVREAVTSLESRRFMDDLRAYYGELRKNEDEWNDLTQDAEELAKAAIRRSWDDESTPPG